MSQEKIPREILEKTLPLRKHQKMVYLALYRLQNPSSASDISQTVGKTRARVSAILNRLEDMGLVERNKKGRTVMFEVVK